ncbi:MAG: UDP-2,3-diacylglucosamine diphosphatase, partial [Moraxellaceae bacterium]
KLNKKQLKTLIHGHTHRPAVHELTIPENAKRYVLGDWDQFGWALIADSKGLHLNKFTL